MLKDIPRAHFTSLYTFKVIHFNFYLCSLQKEKLTDMYRAPAADYAVVKVDQALVYRTDLESLCPQALLQDDLHASYPWLTDDVVTPNTYVVEYNDSKC